MMFIGGDGVALNRLETVWTKTNIFQVSMVYNTAVNNPIIFPVILQIILSFYPDNYHSSYDVYWSRGVELNRFERIWTKSNIFHVSIVHHILH